MSAHATEKGLQLHFDNDLPDALTLWGDPIRVRQIVLNFVSNAVKFTAQGGVTVKASWTPDPAQADRGRFALEVVDTGIGIPADKIPLLFQAFTQADTSTTRHHGGTGLGLAICKRLCDLMGGAIGLRSTPNVGTTLSFTLDCDALPIISLPALSAGSEDSSDPILNRALVVDDMRLNRELLKVMLRRFGLEADLAPGGPEAVKLAAANRYAIIFTDLEMPEMDGFATARQIRAAEGPRRRTPMVAVSALTAVGTRDNCIAAGMDDYLTKPVYLPALESVIEAFLPGQYKLQKPSAPKTEPTVQTERKAA